MTKIEPPVMIQANRTLATTRYMPGFGNDFETEALPGALPQGMNSPQKCAFGLYGEQLSGTAFTATRPERTWCYRIRPSVKHSGRYSRIDVPFWKTAPNVVENVTSLGQYRWDPVPHSGQPLTWITGMRTMTTAGDVNTQVGMASHIYLVTESMTDDYFFLGRQRGSGGAAGGPVAVLHRAWHHRSCPAGDRRDPARPRLPGRTAGRPGAGVCLRELRPERSSSFPAAARSGPTVWPTRATSRHPSPPSRTARCPRPSRSSGAASSTAAISGICRWMSWPVTATTHPASTT
jgi:hypothetical protein